MIVVDEYLAVRVVAGAWPDGLPDDDIATTTSRWWRLLQRIHNPAGGQLSAVLGNLDESDHDVIRRPHPEVLHILDPRPLLDDAAAINARYNSAGLLVAETLTSGLVHGRQLWFGPQRNVGIRLAEIAADLGGWKEMDSASGRRVIPPRFVLGCRHSEPKEWRILRPRGAGASPPWHPSHSLPDT